MDSVDPKKREHGRIFTKIDLLDASSLSEHATEFNPTHVLHLGARTDLDGKTVSDYAANMTGVENLLTALAGCNVERVIFASSRLVCKIGYSPKDEFDVRPSTPYGESKVAGERLVREAAPLPYTWTIVRPTSIWGPWFGVPYRTFFDSVLSGRYVHPGKRRVRKSFGYVGNTVFELEKLLEAPTTAVGGKTFYLGDDPPIEVLEFANTIRSKSGSRPVRQVPPMALRAIARVGDAAEFVTGSTMPLTSFRLKNLETEMVYDLTELNSVVGPLPFSSSAGIDDTLAWINRQNG